jgi:hypothetical protein
MTYLEDRALNSSLGILQRQSKQKRVTAIRTTVWKRPGFTVSWGSLSAEISPTYFHKTTKTVLL